jgi:hypothetical protein
VLLRRSEKKGGELFCAVFAEVSVLQLPVAEEADLLAADGTEFFYQTVP